MKGCPKVFTGGNTLPLFEFREKKKNFHHFKHRGLRTIKGFSLKAVKICPVVYIIIFLIREIKSQRYYMKKKNMS